ncbi:MAG: hypothetical protein EOO57_16015 [Hymenobacter sp.]|nr:MAG: hypothetical protein EOO57_16015 [Hymenobacter sp.]
MKTWLLTVAVPLGLAAGPPHAQPPKPAPNVLRRPGETTVFSFKTSRGKTVSLCEGPKGAYLVYRYGTAAKTELQYPAVLDASSWQKFTYFGYHRSAIPVSNYYRLSFSNSGTKYELYDREEEVIDEEGNEEYPREVGITVDVPKGSNAVFEGEVSSVYGGLMLTEKQQQRVKIEGDE